MGDFFSALPRGESANQLYTNDFTLPPIPLKKDGIGFIGVFQANRNYQAIYAVDGTHPWQLCRSCD